MVDLLLILPFALLLGAMAALPVLAPHWWERHYPKVALGLGALMAGYYLFVKHDSASVLHAGQEYAGFMALVGSLFVVGGGIQIVVPGQSTPLKNVLFLSAGAVLANVLGTTGAAMLLIRPWLKFNRPRLAPHHGVFFIFLVANVGGGLTPIGDPPLFLGYLQGVPFWWVLQRCGFIWLVMVAGVLSLFYLKDARHFRQTIPVATTPPPAAHWSLVGSHNLLFLGLILAAVFLPEGWREAVMLAAAVGSYFTTSKVVHQANGFNFHPAMEVAVLFAGVFITMIPALAWLGANAHRVLGAHQSPGGFYWASGLLSAVLDNAPTYLGFWQTLQGLTGITEANDLLAQQGAQVAAISMGAVFFGAATYIGNGPNFLVKNIAEREGLRMPAFFEYIGKFALPGLLPVLLLVWWLFFRS